MEFLQTLQPISRARLAWKRFSMSQHCVRSHFSRILWSIDTRMAFSRAYLPSFAKFAMRRFPSSLPTSSGVAPQVPSLFHPSLAPEFTECLVGTPHGIFITRSDFLLSMPSPVTTCDATAPSQTIPTNTPEAIPSKQCRTSLCRTL